MKDVSKVKEVLDRMTMESSSNFSSKRTLGEISNSEAFIPSTTWQGSKPGYYFGTASKGTGYYVDKQKHPTDASSKPKKMVKIAEENNEMRLLPEKLLEYAEKKAKGTAVIELTPKGIKSASNALVKIANQNIMQRSQFKDDPQQYMDSELALYDQLTALQAVAANSQLYQYLDNSSLMSTLTQLLSHENADVAACVVALFLEWLDPSLLAENPELKEILLTMARNFLRDSWETVVWNLSRFQSYSENQDYSQDIVLKGVQNSLSLMENLLELDLLAPEGLLKEDGISAAAFMAKESHIVQWLLKGVEAEENDMEFRGRCIELLAFVAQKEDIHTVVPDWNNFKPISKSEDDEEKLKGKKTKENEKEEKIQGIEIFLLCIGKFRKKNPENDEEVEFLENACIALSSCITFSTVNLSAFLEGQGIELVVRCLKEKVHAGGCSLKLLDFFGVDPIHKTASERLVIAGGLKYLFPVFLGTWIPKPAPQQARSSKNKRKWLHSIETQTIRIFYALSRHLDDNSSENAKARFLAKFAQDERKCDRLVELLLAYDQRARMAEYNFYRSGVEEEVEEEETVQLAALDAKLNGGGDIFHRLGALTAYVCVHSRRCHERILSQLTMQQSGISLVKAALEEFVSLVDSSEQKEQLESYLGSL